MLFVNTMSLTCSPGLLHIKSCTLPTQSARDDNLEGIGSHLQIDHPVPLLDKAVN